MARDQTPESIAAKNYLLHLSNGEKWEETTPEVMASPAYGGLWL